MNLAVRYPRVIVATALALGVAACSTSQENATLEQARARVAAIAQDPMVNRGAPGEVRSARESLNIAEAAWADGASEEEVRHRAYLAMQRAALAEETARLSQTREQIQRASIERDRPAPRSQVVTLSNVLFKHDEAELLPGAAPTLEQLASFLRDNPDTNVTLEGYTDSTGSDSYNLQLSQRRAEAVRTALVRRGIDPTRVNARGMGESVPVASNDTVQGRQLNRRVEVVLTSPTGQPTSASGAPAPRSGTTDSFSPTQSPSQSPPGSYSSPTR